jgi:putative ABC transport system permease protein
MPGGIPVVGAATLLLLAAVVASVVPAFRAARVNVMDALRAE